MGKRWRKKAIDDDESEGRRKTANLRERHRTQELNSAFNELRKRIPTMPADKMSKVHSLRIAAAYITYLLEILNGTSEVAEFMDSNSQPSFHFWRSQKHTANSQAFSTYKKYQQQQADYQYYYDSTSNNNSINMDYTFHNSEESKAENSRDSSEYSSTYSYPTNHLKSMDQKKRRIPKPPKQQ